MAATSTVPAEELPGGDGPHGGLYRVPDARELAQRQLDGIYRRTDHMLAGLLVLEWLAAMAAALLISPRSWQGATSSVHPHVWAALLLGGAITSLPVALAWLRPGKTSTRHVIAFAQMTMSALLIHLSGGRIETHFHVFGSLAFLAFYRDTPVLITAATTIILDHVLRGLFWPQSVYGVLAASLWRSLEHGGWVAFEVIFLAYLVGQSRQEIQTTAEREVELETEIAERRRSEARIQHARQVAEAATMAKSEFLANMSHEIRTPMNGVIGMADLALDLCESKEQRSYLTMLQSSAQSLLAVINEILDFSKIEAGKLELHPAVFSLRQTVGQTVQVLALAAEEKGLELLLEVDPDTCDLLVGDAGRLNQVLTNLIGNAIKFTERGEIRVAVGPVANQTAQGDDTYALQFRVRDTGVGIPPEAIGKIFEAFSQVDGSTTRRHGGTGLGLAISERLLAMMGGRIHVASECGRGSEFSFIVYLRVAGKAAQEAPTLEAALPRGVRVLVADDNQSNRQILTAMLERAELRPTVVADGAAAVAALRAAVSAGTPFEIALLDRHMPGLDGFGVVEAMRADGPLQSTPILMLSSAERAEDTTRCRALGVNDYLIKPIFQAELLRGIALALQRDARPEPESVHRAASAAPQAVMTCRRILLVEDNPINQVLVVSMLEKRGYEVTVASDGAEALDVLTGESFDLVLMDVQMPGMGGLEATRQIRAREQGTGRHVPIVAMTARAMVGDRDICLEAGMDAYLAKPVDRRTLLSLVAGFLGHLSQGGPTDEGEINAILDPEATLDRVDGDLRLFREIRQIFFSQCPQRMQAIRRALDEQDPGSLADAAHGLRNSLNNFAAPAAAAAALRLEEAAIAGNLTGAREALATLDQEVARVKMALSTLVIQPPG